MLVGPVLAAPVLMALVGAPAHGASRHCGGLAVTIAGTPGADTLTGTTGDDVIAGLGGADTVDGRGGNDVICGNLGRDRIDGGGGNDRVFGSKGLDHLGGGAGDDTLDGGLGDGTDFSADGGDDDLRAASLRVSVSFAEAPEGVSVDLGAGTASGWGRDTLHVGSAHVAVTGSAHPDTLLGCAQGESLGGLAGFDTIEGRTGNDRLPATRGSLVGGDGDDALGFHGGDPGSASTLDGGSGNDHFWSDGSEQVLGGAGDDVVEQWFTHAVPGDEADLDGGDGVDKLELWALGQSSTLLQPAVFDMSSGTLDAEGLQGTAVGFENLFAIGDAASFDLAGTDGPNSFEIDTNSEPVTVHGRDGVDVMNGSSGDDSLDGGPGDDTADGHNGTDTCTSIEQATDCEVTNP